MRVTYLREPSLVAGLNCQAGRGTQQRRIVQRVHALGHLGAGDLAGFVEGHFEHAMEAAQGLDPVRRPPGWKLARDGDGLDDVLGLPVKVPRLVSTVERAAARAPQRAGAGAGAGGGGGGGTMAAASSRKFDASVRRSATAGSAEEPISSMSAIARAKSSTATVGLLAANASFPCA